MTVRDELDPELLALLQDLEARSPVVTTIADGKANRIAGVGTDGVWMDTERSNSRGTGPQLVPAWMIQTAWDHLRETGSLTNRELFASDGLNVKRSSAVCALLARLPGVAVDSSRPIRLTYEPPSR